MVMNEIVDVKDKY